MESEKKTPREKHTSNNNSKRKRFNRDSTRNNNSNSRGQKKSLDCLLHGKDCGHSTAVSYTHLTLPTNRCV